MKGFLFVFVAVLLALVACGRPGTAESPPDGDADLVITHLGTAMAQMDRGPRAPEYRESLAFLRAHAQELVARLRGSLLDEPGSFSKWQLTYLIGEFGDESAIRLLRDLLDTPLPNPASSRATEHEIDLRYAEELSSRTQAVMSTARIAHHRPELRPRVVSELLEIAREIPLAKSTALFELRKLLGPEFEPVRVQFGPGDAKHFDGFNPSPQWQALLSRRIAAHERQEREMQERREPLCRRN